MIKFIGKGVCGAVAIGKISLFKRNNIKIESVKVDDKEYELNRFEKAKQSALVQLEEIYNKALAEAGEDNAQIFEIHMMMIEDEDYNDAITDMISSQGFNAEYAVSSASDSFAEMFSSMDGDYMQARAADVRDISDRIISCLTDSKTEQLSNKDKLIICADDLAPSETISLDKNKVLAFFTAYGSSNSHTAILAKSMNIPAIIGVGEEFLEKIEDDQSAIADGFNGELIINPDSETLAFYEKKLKEDNAKNEALKNLRGKENITLDGTRIDIFANIGSVKNVDKALENDAGGIGLFRSEFLYLENSDFPTEEEQFTAYKNVLEKMSGKKVIIRTMDIGADKQADYFNLDKEDNPALGL